MIDLDEVEYVRAFWFVPGPGQDYMCGIFRKIGAKKLTVMYRFRYYGPVRTPDPFDNGDRKSWYLLEPSEKTDDEVVAIFTKVIGELADRWGVTADFVDVDGSPEKCIEMMASRPWAHRGTPDCPEPNAPGGSA